MTIRTTFFHATAVALAGWYLMVPPADCKPGWLSEGKPAPCAAPISEWIVALSFTHLERCDAERGADVSTARDAAANAKDSSDQLMITSTAKVYWRALTERCVSTDDPGFAP
jgi:hypothetical protein